MGLEVDRDWCPIDDGEGISMTGGAVRMEDEGVVVFRDCVEICF